MTDEPERVARATLTRIAEPAVPSLVRHVRSVGAVQAVSDLRAGLSMGGVDVDALQHRLRTADGYRDLDTAARVGARLICPGDAEWPRALRDLEALDADCLALWALGQADLRECAVEAVAVVGTRAATEYGVTVAADLALGLAERGWTVVSGMAFGIDGAAHRAALAGGGATVAVLACGVDVIYPKAHRCLYDQIVASGLVVSEHPPGASPQRPRFLVRNRLIAAL